MKSKNLLFLAALIMALALSACDGTPGGEATATIAGVEGIELEIEDAVSVLLFPN